MESHSSSPWETAPASLPAGAGVFAAICFVSFLGWPHFLVMKDQMEVCSLSCGLILPYQLNPYPFHYRGAFAFSIFLCPPFHRSSLRLTFPFRRTTLFPRSVSIPR